MHLPLEMFNLMTFIWHVTLPSNVLKSKQNCKQCNSFNFFLYKYVSNLYFLQLFPEADLHIVADAGHSKYEPGIQEKLLTACEKYKHL